MSASVISIDNNNNCGYLDIIIGPMYSGKTNYLLREMNIFSVMGSNVIYINHILDTRSDIFSTHNSMISKDIKDIKTVKTEKLHDLYDICKDFLVIAIDEAQFFNDLTDFVLNMVEKEGKRVIVAGLNGDFRRKVFGQILDLIPYSDKVTKLSAFCKLCSENKKIKEAHFSYKFEKDENSISIGGSEKYIPLCRECYISHI
jgi:thymidine kinase